MDTLRRKLKQQQLGDSDDIICDARKSRRSHALSTADSTGLGETRRSYRAPDPTQSKGMFGSKRGLATVNLKRRGLENGNTLHRKSSMKSLMTREDSEEPVFLTSSGTLPRQKMSNVINKTLGRKNRKLSLTAENFGLQSKRSSVDGDQRKEASYLEAKGRPKSSGKLKKASTMERSNRKTLNRERRHSQGTEESEILSKSSVSSRKNRKTISPLLKKRMQGMGKNFFKGVYKRSPSRSVKEMDASEEHGFGGSDTTGLESGDGKFQQLMQDKHLKLSGQYTFDSNELFVRKESSFSVDNPMVLLLGKSKAGKSTVFKQLLSLSGAPPNYARAYIPTRAPVEKDVTINDADLMLVDVGGSKEDVVDWRLYLTNAEVIIYVVALDEYDKLVPISKTATIKPNAKPRTVLQDSLELFDSIVSNGSLLNSKFILLFNKADRFEKKLAGKKISLGSVGAYTDAPTSCDYDQSLQYIKSLFAERADKTENEVQIEVTAAIDADKCSGVLNRLTSRMVKSKDVTKWKNLL